MVSLPQNSAPASREMTNVVSVLVNPKSSAKLACSMGGKIVEGEVSGHLFTITFYAVLEEKKKVKRSS